MRKIFKAILITLLLVSLVIASAFLMPSCQGKTVKVSKIEVVTGSLKSDYALDEKIDYSKGKIKVTFTNGLSELISITEDMVSGFDSSTTKSNATMTISYKGHEVSFFYNVSFSVPVQTAFRVELTKKSEESRVVIVEARAKGIEGTGPIYAIKLTIQSSKDVIINSTSLKLSGFVKVEEKKSNNEISLILYSSDGSVALTEDVLFLQIMATKSSKTGTIYAQSISISDGENDISVPPSNHLNIGD